MIVIKNTEKVLISSLKKVEDTWYEVPLKEDTLTLEEVLHRPGTFSSLTLKVTDLDYKLTPGKYRATLGELADPFEIAK